MKTGSRVLLISNSTVHGRSYLDHVEDQIKPFLGSAKTVLFVPFALFDRDDYAARAKARFAEMGYALKSAHAADNPQKAIAETDAIFIGGGNTFRLLKSLQDLELLERVRDKVRSGASRGVRKRESEIPALDTTRSRNASLYENATQRSPLPCSCPQVKASPALPSSRVPGIIRSRPVEV